MNIKKNNKGFSLVELIVVIAIMAVLAAVAVVGVSIYIPKAQKASDDQLVADINYIFKTACLDAGVELSDVTAATWDAENWELDAVTITGDATGALAEKLIESFNDLYEVKNPEIKQEGYAIQYNGSKFVCAAVGSVGISRGDYDYGTIEIKQEDIDAFKGTAFDKMGVEYLMSQMNGVVAYASSYDRLLVNVVNDEAFLALRNSMYPDYALASEEDKRNMDMQVLVLYTAERSEIDAKTLYDFVCENPGAYIGTNKSEGNEWRDTDGKAFAANGAMYGLGLAFAESDKGKEITSTLQIDGQPFDKNNPDHIIELMRYQEEGTNKYGQGNGEFTNSFSEWLKEDEDARLADINGFQGAMGMLTDNKGNLDPDMLLQDGYGNDSFVNCLKGLLGNSN